MEPGSVLDQGPKILQACTSQKNPKESISEGKFLKICSLQSQSSYAFILLDFFMFLWFISSVSGWAICILLLYKELPRKIFLLKRKFVLLLLPCRKVITEKQQQSSETALLVYQAHVRPRRRLCEGRRLLRLWGLFYGSFGIICAVIASTTYISSGVFYTSFSIP